MVLLTGPRQVEKSTLARRAAQTALRNRITLAGRPAAASATISRHFNLDGRDDVCSHFRRPQGWLQNYRSPDWTVMDEVQRFPDLLIAIKREVYLDRRPNRY